MVKNLLTLPGLAKDGTFRLPFLRRTNYRVYGIEDIDQSSTYNLPTEVLALADTAFIQFSDTTNTKEVTLLRFIPDEQAPAINGFSWLSDSILKVEFSEGDRIRFLNHQHE